MRETSTDTQTSASNTIVRVQWKTRTTGFDSSSVEVSRLPDGRKIYIEIYRQRSQSIIQKACAHFHLGPSEKKHILLGEVDGIELELSDDMLKHLPSGALVKLTKAPVVVVNSDSDNDDAASTISDETRSYIESEPPRYPHHQAR